MQNSALSQARVLVEHEGRGLLNDAPARAGGSPVPVPETEPLRSGCSGERQGSLVLVCSHGDGEMCAVWRVRKHRVELEGSDGRCWAVVLTTCL